MFTFMIYNLKFWSIVKIVNLIQIRMCNFTKLDVACYSYGLIILWKLKICTCIFIFYSITYLTYYLNLKIIIYNVVFTLKKQYHVIVVLFGLFFNDII